MTAAKNNFVAHMAQCTEAINIYEFLRKSGYSADFGLRFVWVASISALDHYISELIVEKATQHFANGTPLSSKLQNEGVPLSGLLNIQTASPALAVIEFRKIISQAVMFRTFQKADDVADGLAYVWNEDHKWNKISKELGLDNKPSKRKLNGIAYRRDSIVHSADYDESSGKLRPCILEDAKTSAGYISDLVDVIDSLVP